MKEKLQTKKMEWLSERDVFFTSIFIGVLTHGYMMMNKLPNIDDYICIFHYGHGYALGRWLLALMGNFMFRIDGTYSLPFFNGTLYLLCLSLSVTIFLKPFAFQSRWIKRGFAALFVSFPTVTATFGFMFTAPFYGVAVVFTAVAFYLVVSYRHGWLLSVALICCSLGIYQGYWGLVAGFLLLYLLMICMKEETKEREIVWLALKSLAALLIGVLAYLVINSIMLKVQGIELSGYQGVSEMGRLELSQIPDILRNAYGWFFRFTSENYLHITWYPVVRVVIAVGYIISAVFGVMAGIRNRKKICKCIGLMVFTAIFPLAVNSIYILCNDATSVHTLMCYSVVLVFLLPFVFLGGITAQGLKETVISAIKYGYLAAIMLVTFFYVRFGNIYYLNLELAYSQAYSFMETLSTRIQEVDDYSADKQLLFYGMYQGSPNRNIWELRMVNTMTGTIDVDSVINAPLIRKAFSRVYLGNTFNEVADMSAVEDSLDRIHAMPSYPADGSIAVINDVIVVKLADTQTQ